LGKSWHFGSGKGFAGRVGSLAMGRMQKKVAAAATGGILSSLGKLNGNPGSMDTGAADGA
jgi:hypothetical protein